MRKIFSTLLIFLIVTPVSIVTAQASDPTPLLTAKPIAEVIREIDATTYQFKESGMLFGYDSLESCLWVSEKTMIVQHYCYPAGNYPARSVSLWSADFGVIYLYEEKLSNIVKHDLLITDFPENLTDYLIPDFRQFTIARMTSVMEKLYNADLPGCWSTNYDFYTQAPDTGCYRTDIASFPGWAQETQAIVGSNRDWQNLYRSILRKLR